MSTGSLPLGQGLGLTDTYLTSFRIVNVTHAARGTRRPWEVAFGHQFIEGLGISAFDCFEHLDSILDIGQVEPFLRGFLGFAHCAYVIQWCGQWIAG
ncbi:MAG: hypothetical protein COC21_02295 [Verrucomicrobiales bacterium]|nr:MAG: hypothetical protein COC21_02295 [Verrucomicrobiales bacterium]